MRNIRLQAGPAKVKAGIGTITGYAAVYYNPKDPGSEYMLHEDSEGPIVEHLMPGCFDRALRTKGQDATCLMNHDANLLLGRQASGSLRLVADRKGLRYECQLPDTSVGRDVRELIRRRDMTGSSFSFKVQKENWRQEGRRVIRELLDLDLDDVSPVTSPAYLGTSVTLSGVSDDDIGAQRPDRGDWRDTLRRMRLRLAECA